MLHNHFVTVRRTKKTIRIGSRYQRRYEKAKTPYKMVMKPDEISKEQKHNLKKIHNSLNIFELQKDLKKLFTKRYKEFKGSRGKLY